MLVTIQLNQDTEPFEVNIPLDEPISVRQLLTSLDEALAGETDPETNSIVGQHEFYNVFNTIHNDIKGGTRQVKVNDYQYDLGTPDAVPDGARITFVGKTKQA